MTTNASYTSPASPWYPIFKIAVLALLASNAAIYALSDTPSTTLDAIAWLVLLLLFELETVLDGRPRASRLSSVVHIARGAAILAIGMAALAFVRENAWIDAINSALWIAVVVLLEFEVRFPLLVALRPSAFLAIASALYAGLSILVVVWAWRGEWLDAYDALLWIIAFAIIEMDVLRFSRRSAAGCHGKPGLECSKMEESQDQI